MIRRKVAERLQARRRTASGGDRASSLPSPDAVFSASVKETTPNKTTARTDSVEGFLVVDDRDGQSDASADELEDHEALRQAVGDDLSGFEVAGVLDEAANDEEGELIEDPSAPRPKPTLTPTQPAGRVRSGALSTDNDGGVEDGSLESATSSKPSVKPWQMLTEKDVYEQQLEVMQEQLTAAMIEKEELRSM